MASRKSTFDDVGIGRVGFVVAIPVRNEADRIEACLRALADQKGAGASQLGVVLFLNNCSDDTAHKVAVLRPTLPFPVQAIERTFAQANAGWARREAMEAAAVWLERSGSRDGVILTTDADSRVPPDWLARNLAAVADGAEGVAGRIALDPEEAAGLPAALHARGRLEAAYEALLTELEARIDPIPHDPWPRHRTTSGATLAVRLAAYRQIGGMPPLASGEDRAFVSSLLSSDVRVRHDPGVVVVTSGRLEGRASGGAADTMRMRCERPESPCDPGLEPLPWALFRYAWRRRLRGLRGAGRLGRVSRWAPWLGIGTDAAKAIAGLPATGAVLAAVEAASPLLTDRPLLPSELPAQIRRARIVLGLLRGRWRFTRTVRLSGVVVTDPLGGNPVERPGNV